VTLGKISVFAECLTFDTRQRLTVVGARRPRLTLPSVSLRRVFFFTGCPALGKACFAECFWLPSADTRQRKSLPIFGTRQSILHSGKSLSPVVHLFAMQAKISRHPFNFRIYSIMAAGGSNYLCSVTSTYAKASYFQ
jgi:hypothetical protein